MIKNSHPHIKYINIWLFQEYTFFYNNPHILVTYFMSSLCVYSVDSCKSLDLSAVGPLVWLKSLPSILPSSSWEHFHTFFPQNSKTSQRREEWDHEVAAPSCDDIGTSGAVSGSCHLCHLLTLSGGWNVAWMLLAAHASSWKNFKRRWRHVRTAWNPAMNANGFREPAARDIEMLVQPGALGQILMKIHV